MFSGNTQTIREKIRGLRQSNKMRVKRHKEVDLNISNRGIKRGRREGPLPLCLNGKRRKKGENISFNIAKI